MPTRPVQHAMQNTQLHQPDMSRPIAHCIDSVFSLLLTRDRTAQRSFLNIGM